jgi:hypothetical protein
MSEEAAAAAGAAVSAGLAARAMEGGGADQTVHGGACANCGASLSGRYCAACGQPAHLHRSLGHLVEETLHGVTHFDTKAWRTLPRLVLRPGHLTSDYIHGRRARYISPLALFLFVIFLMFFVFALAGGPRIGVGEAVEIGAPERLARAETRLAEARTALAEAEIAAEAMRAEGFPGAAAAAEGMLAGVRVATENAETEVARAKAARDGVLAPEPGAGTERRWQDEVRVRAERGDIQFNTGYKAVDERIKKKLLNPDLALYKIQQAAYKFSFLLVPLSLPFVALLFLWKRGFTLYDHGVFVLYSLSFMCLLFIVLALLSSWFGEAAETATGPLAVFGPTAHMFFHLKGTYGLGGFSALWRTVLLLFFALIVLSIFVGLIVILGLVG